MPLFELMTPKIVGEFLKNRDYFQGEFNENLGSAE